MQINNQLQSLKGLDKNLKEIHDYLRKVIDGKLPINHKIIYNLQDIFNLLPNIDTSTKQVNESSNDQVLVVMISSMIRSVLALHNLIENKGMLRELEVVGTQEVL